MFTFKTELTFLIQNHLLQYIEPELSNVYPHFGHSPDCLPPVNRSSVRLSFVIPSYSSHLCNIVCLCYNLLTNREKKNKIKKGERYRFYAGICWPECVGA